MKKIKISKNERMFLLLQGVFVFLLLGFGFLVSSPEAVSPISGKNILDNDFVFEIENGDKVVLANDENFTNSVVLDDESYVTLAPGRYYWKVKGTFRESDVRSFVIEEIVGLEMHREDDVYELKNSGNVDLNVSKNLSNENITSGSILNVGEKKSVEKDNSVYEGEKNE